MKYFFNYMIKIPLLCYYKIDNYLYNYLLYKRASPNSCYKKVIKALSLALKQITL